MPRVLAFNPGSNSLKFEVIDVADDQRFASEGKKLVSGSIEDIGKKSQLQVFAGREVESKEAVDAGDFSRACHAAAEWMRKHKSGEVESIDLIAIRVVHGADRYDRAVMLDEQVERTIQELEELAPLHNKNSLLVARGAREAFGRNIPAALTFDTAFHRSIPEYAALYAIPRELSEKHKIRRYGFHGPSHRYQMEHYARVKGRQIDSLNLVTTHLESGCSATAIRQGKSIDNTMGLTPLEGLMMGTRSGDVDPSLIEFLERKEKIDTSEVMTLLNKKSGLLGVSGESLDTRVLMKKIDSNPQVRLAMEMFAYRVRKAVGAYLAALGGADAVIFGGGIGEDTPWVRERVCEGLEWCGLRLDAKRNQEVIYKEGRISTDDSTLEAYVIPVEEGLQIAHECAIAWKEAA